MNVEQLHRAHRDWETFLKGLADNEKEQLNNVSELLEFNKLHYYVATKDNIKFDQTVNILSKQYLYNEEVIPAIYFFYTERGMHELAYDYLCKAESYIREIGDAIPANIQTIIDGAENINLFQKLKIGLEKILTLNPKNIPFVTPEKHNAKNELSEFILHELILATKVMLEKIQGVKLNRHEDRYNDLLLATLRLRFPIWGWSIHDQARTGTSPTGKNAGETDITIQSGAITIALVEALVLTRRNAIYTKKHVEKIFSYSNQLSRYYVVIYFKGPAKNFEHVWNCYQQDVLKAVYPSGFIIDKKIGFKDMWDKFDDINHLKVAKTKHGTNIDIFHLMIDISN
jgi:hypothetical protein